MRPCGKTVAGDMRDRGALKQGTAISRVAEALAALSIGERSLTATELTHYAKRQFVAGWRFPIEYPDGIRRMDLLIGKHFPREAPRVALVDRPEFLTLPHVERDGVLCILPNSAEVNPSRPDAVAKAILASAAELLEAAFSGRLRDDFREEFRSYWDWQCDHRVPTIYTLLESRTPSRPIRLWRGHHFCLAAEDDATLHAWLRHRFPNIKEANLATEPAMLLWLEHAPTPDEYPQCGTDLLEIAERQSAEVGQCVQRLVADMPADLVVVLGASTTRGSGFVGVSIPRPQKLRYAASQHRNESDPLTHGFRANKMPSSLLAQRYLGSRVVRRTAERADAAWVHGRDQDGRVPILRAARVAILGCGSVGAPVAIALAQAAVGELILIDPDDLRWANVGRHPLGAESVGRNKAIALREYILGRLPHVSTIQCRHTSWQDALQADPDLFESLDLIISAIGSWGAEGALNEWHLTCGGQIPIVYGWTEAHGCAGHAVSIVKNSGCLQCGLTETGVARLQVTQWPDQGTLKQEPACGAVYQPYGAVEIGHTVALIADLALSCLLQAMPYSTHRIWVGRQALLESAGGRWSSEWTRIAGDRLHGGFIEEREWAAFLKCCECSAEAA